MSEIPDLNLALDWTCPRCCTGNTEYIETVTHQRKREGRFVEVVFEYPTHLYCRECDYSIGLTEHVPVEEITGDFIGEDE